MARTASPRAPGWMQHRARTPPYPLAEQVHESDPLAEHVHEDYLLVGRRRG